jgi:hypothetical protein
VRCQLPDAVTRFEQTRLSAHADPHLLSRKLREAIERSWCSLAELRAWLRTQVHELDGSRAPEDHGVNHPHVLIGGLHALLVALWPEGDPQDLLAGAVREGGDTDTVGAICGGLLGSRFGCGFVALERLLDASNLRAYAACLHTRELPEEYAAFLRREAVWTKHERVYQRELLQRARTQHGLPSSAEGDLT